MRDVRTERGGRGGGYGPGSADFDDLVEDIAARDVLALLTRPSLLYLARRVARAQVAVLACWPCVPNMSLLSTAGDRPALAPVDGHAGLSARRRFQHHAAAVRFCPDATHLQWVPNHRGERAARGPGTWGGAGTAPATAHGPHVARQACRQQRRPVQRRPAFCLSAVAERTPIVAGCAS